MRIELSSGTPAELVRSDSAALGLVIAADIFGLRPLYVELAERLSRERNYTVCVPEPFPGRELGPDIDARRAAVSSLRDADVLGDLALAAAATGIDRVALIGFCMGGMYTFKAAGTGRFSRCAAFYGMIRIPPDWRGDGHAEPLDALARPGATPTLAIIGELDPYTPPDDVKALETRPGVTVVRYPQAEHGFVHDPSRPSHRVADAADAWARALAFVES